VPGEGRHLSLAPRKRAPRLSKIEQLETRLHLDVVQLNLVVTPPSDNAGSFVVYADDNYADGGQLARNTNLGLASYVISVVGSSNVTIDESFQDSPSDSYTYAVGTRTSSGFSGFHLLSSNGLGSSASMDGSGDGIYMYAVQNTALTPPSNFVYRGFGISSGSDASPPTGISINSYTPNDPVSWTQTSLGVDIASGQYSFTGSSATLTVFGDDGANEHLGLAHENNTGSFTVLPAGWTEGNATAYATVIPDEVEFNSPSITSSNTDTFTAGSTGTFTVVSTGSPIAALNESGTLPAGVHFLDNGNGTATLSGTPPVGSDGTYAITLTASNGIAPPGTQTFTLTVDQAPAFISGDHFTFTTGSTAAFNITTTGFPTTALNESGTLPTGITFTDDGNGTATLAGTAALGSDGNYTLTLTANNSVPNAATQTFTVTVDQPPAIVSNSAFAFTAGSSNLFVVSTSGFPAARLSETGSLPNGVSFTDNGNGTASLAGLPADGTAGAYMLTLTASNTLFPVATQTFTLTVDQTPAITSSNGFTLAIGNTTSFLITSTGFPTPRLNETGTLPAGIIFTDDGDGAATLAGTPAADSFGTYDLTITATNGISPSATQSLALIVQAGAVAIGDDGVVSVTGTAANDVGNITESDGTISIDFDGTTQTYSALSVTAINVTLGAGNDSINLGSPNLPPVTVAGGLGNDTIAVVSSNDLLKGGAGDDVFLNDAGSQDTIKGGIGLNFAQNNHNDPSPSNIFQLIDPPIDSAPQSPATPAPADAEVTAAIVDDVLQITGTSGADSISISLNGKATKLKVEGDGSFVGAFPLTGLTGISIAGKGANDSIAVGSSITLPATLKGGGGNDSLTGGGGDNVLVGGAGSDTLTGGAGVNLLVPQALLTYSNSPTGNDSLVGGSGFSIADFSYRTDPLFLSNDGQPNSGDTAAGEATTVASNISAIWGGTASDTIVGTIPGELLSGGTGADSIQGGGGAGDIIDGGKGKDTVAVAAEPVTLYLADGKADEYSGINNPDEDVLDLDPSLDTVI
jgi:RTX calcium-binding nonapeptide repeat (4 copies)/Putative Ig domain